MAAPGGSCCSTARSKEPSLKRHEGLGSRWCHVFQVDGDEPVTPDAPATVLRVGLHADAKAAPPLLLNALAPRTAIISVGGTNRVSAPSDDTLARHADSGATIYRTDLNGTIRLTSDDTNIWIEMER